MGRPRRRPRGGPARGLGGEGGMRKGKATPSKQAPGSSAHRQADRTREMQNPKGSPLSTAQAWPMGPKSEKSHSSIRCRILLSSNETSTTFDDF